MELKTGQIWKHYKGNEYKIIALPKHSDTEVDMVVYEAQYEPADTDTTVWVKEVSEFLTNVEWEGEIVPRFSLMNEN